MILSIFIRRRKRRRFLLNFDLRIVIFDNVEQTAIITRRM
jgi:hypothetical protein